MSSGNLSPSLFPGEGSLSGTGLESFRGPLMAYFLRHVHDRFEAEDLTQHVFLKLHQHRTTDGINNANAFIFRIASNLLKDRHRRLVSRGREESISHYGDDYLDAVSNSSLPHALVENLTPERALLGKEELNRVISALEELGPRGQQVFLLYRIEKMKQAEIARQLGISISAVEKHIVKSLVHLAKKLGQ